MAAVGLGKAAGIQSICWRAQSVVKSSPAQDGSIVFHPLQAARGPAVCRRYKWNSQVHVCGLPTKATEIKSSSLLRRARMAGATCAFKEHDRPVQEVPQSPSRGDFRLNAMAWLPLVLMVIAETNTGEIHVPASRDFYSSWHLTEEFIKHFYIAFICCFSFGAVYFGSLKDPFYESPGYREDGGNGTAHWFYAVKEEDEEAAREQLAAQVLATEIAEKEKVIRMLQEQVGAEAGKPSAESPKEPVSSL